ncbi:hypothetical protein ESCO_003942 [Escovopsis weberi]|uniref:Gamma-glutamyl cyclotransferase etpK n=1 Tax=Escovopsis weberi TaxID=150374 RepID=ETPK_ESCWE|nr:hypothetical protein ESCO_003942 [Escovopsis weberi]DAB41660.1 TPA_exp: gamma-glutamylcyclotransferase [Escovopsis weberi]
MKASSMKDRKVEPLATKIVNVPTHYVTFDIFGIPYSEPCYASLEAFPVDHDGTKRLELVHNKLRLPVPSLCGVAHLLTPDDFHRLLVTEAFIGLTIVWLYKAMWRLDSVRFTENLTRNLSPA